MLEFVKAQFDKLLLVSVILFFTLTAIYAFHSNEAPLATFAVDATKTLTGALLTLITGRLFNRTGDKPTNNANAS